jgi:lysyl-tRNA synthetase class I
VRLGGDETVQVGIRPFGLHAGNILGIVAYPHLLCRKLRQQGKNPRLRLIVSINDWEQDAPSGPDPIRYPYNIVPQKTTLQFCASPSGMGLVDVWEPRIREAYTSLIDEFDGVRVEFRRTSELCRERLTGHFLAKTLDLAGEIARCLAEKSSFEVLIDDTALFASVACPGCRAARGRTTFRDNNSTVAFQCAACGWMGQRNFAEFDWWWHHKPMFTARWYLWDIQVAISGGDHYVDGDGAVRDALRQVFGLQERNLSMLFSPLLLDRTGVKISKSANNEVMVPYDRLLSAAASTEDVHLAVASLG